VTSEYEWRPNLEMLANKVEDSSFYWISESYLLAAH
jgi:hypothetical protein